MPAPRPTTAEIAEYAERADLALGAYGIACGRPGKPDANEMISDLLHWLDLNGQDARAVLDDATRRWEEERLL